ncbi:BLOC-1-related complex subunit 8 homolog isoform X4 [Lycorma delicatula]|uniref:BLOC-1-related complex subunit 8 homolog isoform X4 n=1 Tax=Lycorma delicatula TaxID=130591 RepID=UPI003F50F95E
MTTLQHDHELDAKVKKATERISENMHIVANEPSLAFYRLQEHVRKALPPMVDKRVEVSKVHHELQGHCYDVEYAIRYYIPIYVYRMLSVIFLDSDPRIKRSQYRSINDYLPILPWICLIYQNYLMHYEKLLTRWNL